MEDLTEMAHRIFPGSTIVSTLTFEQWRTRLLAGVKAACRPTDLVTHLACAGQGCPKCVDGKVPLGDDPPEESRLELGARVLCLARYSCPPERLEWHDQTLDLICRRWDIVSQHNRPTF